MKELKGIVRNHTPNRVIGVFIVLSLLTGCVSNSEIIGVSSLPKLTPETKVAKIQTPEEPDYRPNILINNIYAIEMKSFYKDNLPELRVLIVPDRSNTFKIDIYVQRDYYNAPIKLERCDLIEVSMYEEFMDMAYEDINNDEYPDLIITGKFSTGWGPIGTVPHSQALIYIGKENSFSLDIDLIELVMSEYDKDIENTDELVNWLKDFAISP